MHVPGGTSLPRLHARCSPTTRRRSGRTSCRTRRPCKDPALVNYLTAPRRRRRHDVQLEGPRRPGHADPDAPTPATRSGSTRSAPRAASRCTCSTSAASPGGPTSGPSEEYSSRRGLAAWETLEDSPRAARAAGRAASATIFYGDVRRPFTEAGMWGLMRGLRPEVPDQAAPGTRLHRRGAHRIVPRDPDPSRHGAHDRDDPRRYAAAGARDIDHDARSPNRNPGAQRPRAAVDHRRRHSCGAGCASA